MLAPATLALFHLPTPTRSTLTPGVARSLSRPQGTKHDARRTKTVPPHSSTLSQSNIYLTAPPTSTSTSLPFAAPHGSLFHPASPLTVPAPHFPTFPGPKPILSSPSLMSTPDV
ncbi:hypothetical protein B0H11DRAFT_2103055 [Mycena galericulata]|nr:hypothetical protein B0H11DRAFT_2103055 [Mycena galericulata]